MATDPVVKEYLREAHRDKRLKFSDAFIISPKPRGLSDETEIDGKPWSELKKKYYYADDNPC